MFAVDRTQRAAFGAGPGPRGRALAVTLAGLGACAEGELVRVTARVLADAGRESDGALGPPGRIAGALHGTVGVFRRLVFKHARATWVHERGVDFWLVDGAARARVCVGGGTLAVDPGELLDYPVRCFAGLELAGLPRSGSLPARERVLTEGTVVEVLGCRTRAADPSGDPVGYRELAACPALRSSREQALILTPIG